MAKRRIVCVGYDGITALDASSLEACLGFAARVGALACTRLGANPPRRTEL